MKPSLFSVGIAGVVPGLLIAFGCAPPIAAQPVRTASAASPTVDRVIGGSPQRKTLKLYSNQPARVEAAEETPLVPKIAGFVQEVLVDIGDRVKRDQPLVKLSVPEMQDELKQKQALVTLAEAEVKQAQATVAAAVAAAESQQAKVVVAEAGTGRAEGEFARWEGEHARIKELSANGSVTRKLLDETENQLRAADASRREANAEVQSAQATLREAQVNVHKAEADAAAAAARVDVAKANLAHINTMLGYTVIKAPFDGIVTRRGIDTGHYVQPAGSGGARPLLVVETTDRVRIAVDVPEMDSARLDPGDSATVRIQSLGGKEFEAKVTRTSYSLEDANHSIRAEIEMDNPSGMLRPGMFATVSLLLEQRENVLTLPATAIVRDGGKIFCCTVQGGKIQRTPIELGLRSGDDVEILSGVEDRQTVVLTRAESLQPGQAVEVSAPPAK